jgi:ferritin
LQRASEKMLAKGSGGIFVKVRMMDNKEYLESLRAKEKTLLERIDKMRKTMNDTVELKTLGFMSEMLEEAKKELNMIQDKLSSAENEEN